MLLNTQTISAVESRAGVCGLETFISLLVGTSSALRWCWYWYWYCGCCACWDQVGSSRSHDEWGADVTPFRVPILPLCSTTWDESLVYCQNIRVLWLACSTAISYGPWQRSPVMKVQF